MSQLNTGDLLIAPVLAADFRFQRSVIMLTYVGPQGTYGLTLNKMTNFTLENILRDQDLEQHPQLIDIPLYWGGPVQSNTVWMLHDAGWSNQHTMMINDSWSMTSHSSMFHALAEGVGPTWYRICHGFSAWRPGQLERELEGAEPYTSQHSWLTAQSPDPEWIQTNPASVLWTTAIDLSAHQAVDHWLA